MPYTVTYTSGRQEVTFSAEDFLSEAISDFLESGAKSSRLASAIVKVATGVELLLKNMLEKVCPALILDKVDDAGRWGQTGSSPFSRTTNQHLPNEIA